MKRLIFFFFLLLCLVQAQAVNLEKCQIVVSETEPPLAQKMASVLAEDIQRVTGFRPQVSHHVVDGPAVILATAEHASQLVRGVDTDGLKGSWERYRIITRGKRLYIIGSDPRGLAYGVLHVSERIGVSPWYWFADVPVVQKSHVDYKENFTSKSPSVKYRGVFINDEDWGLKTWSERNFEKSLGDIGPATYDKVCELLLRLRGNMLAPAMHSCTGAFYSHPESQRVAASWGIMITTSHCEPLLFNNAATSEWDREKDGEWNYLTNKETIWKKLNNRIQETAQYDNIYTMGMRGLHDEAMRGSTDPVVRARTLETVIADQRQILETHKRKTATEIPQIFVPYKETLDIYDAGLRVPDDITLVWPDDNYGYMKRVSNPAERQRTGSAGVYYHISYLGTPHDNLWIGTTAPMLMYEELRKAYDAGSDRYWLLNVGDIKPLEIEIQQFFDMAWDLSAFSYENVNSYQAKWLSSVFGQQYEERLQQILDSYYRLAWQRKPEFMGYEMEWDSEENNKMHDSDFSFDSPDGKGVETSPAGLRLAEYQNISDQVDVLERSLPADKRPAFFEMLGYSVKSAYQMNRKFLMAQRNHETGSQAAAKEAIEANDSLLTLLRHYNTMLDGKWDQMLSQIPPGLVAKYHLMPELTVTPTRKFQLPEYQKYQSLPRKMNLAKLHPTGDFRLLKGIGTDWLSLQMGQPLDEVQDPASLSSGHIDMPLELNTTEADSVTLCISVVPLWPVTTDRSNRIGVSVDGCAPKVCENRFIEWSLPWKLQVLENRKDFMLTLPIDRAKRNHTLTLIIGDPGQIVQGISYDIK